MITLPKEEYRSAAEKMARQLRKDGMNVVTPLGVGSFGAQLKMATRHEAKCALLFGDDEFQRGEILIKHLASGEQTVAKMSEVSERLRSILKK